MSNTLKTRLELAAKGFYLQKRAEKVTDDWLAPRPESSLEHVGKKGFTREQLVVIAETVLVADYIVASERAMHSGSLPSKDGWTPGDEMWNLIRAMYLEPGYIFGFFQHVRESMARELGFTRNPETGIMERQPDKTTGKTKATSGVIRAAIEVPVVARYILADCKRRGIAPTLIEARGIFAAAASAQAEATRKSQAEITGGS
jgi:hypothetical protein